MADVWVRKLGSFEDDRRADREFRIAVTPDARLAALLAFVFVRFQSA